MRLVKEGSNPDANGLLVMYQLSAPMIMGVSPLVIECYREEAVSIRKMADHFGYLSEFVCEMPCRCGLHEEPWGNDIGFMHMKKA